MGNEFDIILVYNTLTLLKGIYMKKIVAALILALFAFSAYAVADKDFGWKPVVDNGGKIIGMSNKGEQGGLLKLSCDIATKKLKMEYHYGKKDFDFYLFRKFGMVDLTHNDTDGKFYVGAGITRQSEVYYNVMNADKAFTVARWPVGSKLIWDHAVKTQSPTGPEITQEGDEVFLAGDGWKPYLKALDANCPINPNSTAAVF